MAKAERNALVGGLAGMTALALGIWYFFFRGDGEKDPAFGPDDEDEEIEVEETEEIEEEEEIDPIIATPVKPVIIARRQIDLTTSGEEYSGVCGVDGTTKVDKARDGPWAKKALTLLGFPVGTLLSSSDKQQIKNFQATARSMDLGAMAGAAPSYVDGVVGLCTLDALVEAAIIYNGGRWGS